MAAECPSPNQLQALLKGEASPEATAALAGHLEQCPGCQQRTEELAGGNTNLPRLRATATPPHAPLLTRLMHKLKDSDPDLLARADGDALLSPGTTLRYFGDYEVLGELGRGGMGVVYRARQLSLNRTVALKLIVAGQLASPSEVRRFRTEAEAAARLDHPNIVPIYEIGEHEQRHYFSMKLVEGRPFSERMSEVRFRQSYSEAALLVAQLARAVHYAHQRGVLHRDLKPSNILLDAQGEPHLSDFGLAKILETDSGLTHSQAILGTPNYLAPEVAAGKAREVTTATDVYSLGAILYEILAGQPPFIEATVAATLQKVLTVEPPSLRARDPSVPRDLETICLKCLAKEPVGRYGTALELAEDLERFTRHEPIAARPVGVPEKVWRWCRRKPALAGSLAALHLVFALGLAGIIWQWQRAENLVRLESHQRRLAQEEGRRAHEAVTRLEIENTSSLLTDGDTSRALSGFARILRREPSNRVAASALLSALSTRGFCLPIASLRHGSLGRSTQNTGRAETQADSSLNESAVAAVNFSPDGSLIVTAGRDGTARIWNGLTGEPSGGELQHGGEVYWADFDSTGRRLVTASHDRTARIWDAATTQPITPPMHHRDAVWHASFSPDGRHLITASDDHTAMIWDATNSASPEATLAHANPVYFAAFSPDGRRVLTAERAGPARLWEWSSGRLIADIAQQFRQENARSFPLFLGNDRFAITRRLQAVIWSETGGSRNELALAHDEPVLGLALSPDGQRLATFSHDASVRLWDTVTGRPIARPLRHQNSVHSAQFSADGRWLVTASRDRTARLWDATNGLPAGEPLRHESSVLAVRIAPDGRRLVTTSVATGAWLWEVRPTEPSAVSLAHSGRVDLARFNPAGDRVVVASGELVHLWNLETVQAVGTPIRHAIPQLVLDLDFSRDGRYFATATEHGNARIWDAATGASAGPRFSRNAGPGPGSRLRDMRMIRFHPDGRRVLTASDDGTACLWDAMEGKLIWQLEHGSRVNCAQISPDGARILSAGWDGTARLWDTDSGQAVGEPLPHPREVDWAAFDPTGDVVATAAKDKRVRLWSAKNGDLLTPPLVHADPLVRRHSLDFSPDGSLLATATGASLQIWEVRTGKPVTPPLQHGGRIHSVRFSPHDARVVTASDDGYARIWDARTGHLLAEPMRHDAVVTYAEFSADGTRVLSSSRDGSARIWRVLAAPLPVPDWLPDLAEALAGQQLDEGDVNQTLSVESLHYLIQKLRNLPANDYYSRWARWFVTAAPRQDTSPFLEAGTE